MQERIRQAKEDWWQVRASFLNLKTQLMSEANNDLEKNKIKREVNKMKKQSEDEFKNAERQHQQRIEWALNKKLKHSSTTLTNFSTSQYMDKTCLLMKMKWQHLSSTLT